MPSHQPSEKRASTTLVGAVSAGFRKETACGTGVRPNDAAANVETLRTSCKRYRKDTDPPIYTVGGRLPITKNTSARTKPTTNRIHAIWLAAPAIPTKPHNPATIATMKMITAQ